MAEQALSDVKVLDLTWQIAGPYCTKLLADYGADVIKIERPGTGDPARTYSPFLHDEPHPEKSGYFMYLNNNKRGITLNLKTKSGQKIFKELVKDVDIVVENFSPRVMPSLGLSYEELKKINPNLVMTSISNFGQTGPYRDYKASNLIEDAMGHTMLTRGTPDREPSKSSGDAMLYQGGNMAAAATMLALWTRDDQGICQQIDVSIMEVHLTSIDFRGTYLLSYQYAGIIAHREYGLSFGILPMGVFNTIDGFIESAITPVQWPRVIQMLEIPDLAERFPNILDMSKKEEMEAVIIPWFFERTKREVTEKAQKAKTYIMEENTPGDAVEDPHFNARGFFIEVNHPEMGTVKQPGPPFRPTENPWVLRRPAPLLGQHNSEVYCDQLGYSKQDLVKLRELGVI